MISPAQCRAARALIGWSTERLAEASRVSRNDIAAFENGRRTIEAPAIEALQQALEQGGTRFIAEGKARGAGVRLKFSSVSVKRIDVWENEGGPTGEDDV